jgi:uncharacterized membrane protein
MWMDWLSLFVRWFHVIAGVAWIGASFYFIWLDNNLETPPKAKQDEGIKGDLWAVHGGGFYEVAKYSYGPKQIPEKLHWFKWEAYTTWISGFALLILVYYFGASAYLIDPSINPLSPFEAIMRGLLMIFGGLFIYELMCRGPLGKKPLLFAFVFAALLCLACYFATQWFSGRGAFIHVGALIGTIMAGNVFFKIMPAQRLMVDAVTHNKPIDPEWGAGAKLRSVHNNYLTLPLLFIMISNHYPMTYQHQHSWLVLVLFIAISAWIRHFFNLKHLGIVKPSILITASIAMFGVAFWVSMPNTDKLATPPSSKLQPESVMTPLDNQVMELVQIHCANCHSSQPTDDMFRVAPLGLMLDTWEQVELRASVIGYRTAVSKDMPFLNKTKMTQEERDIIAKWHKLPR